MKQKTRTYQIVAYLINTLTQEGYTLGTGVHLRIQVLLQKLPEEITDEDLMLAVCPLLAHAPKDEELIYEKFKESTRYADEVHEYFNEKEIAAPPTLIEQKLNRWRWQILAQAIMLLLTTGVAVYFYFLTDKEVPFLEKDIPLLPYKTTIICPGDIAGLNKIGNKVNTLEIAYSTKGTQIPVAQKNGGDPHKGESAYPKMNPKTAGKSNLGSFFIQKDTCLLYSSDSSSLGMDSLVLYVKLSNGKNAFVRLRIFISQPHTSPITPPWPFKTAPDLSKKKLLYDHTKAFLASAKTPINPLQNWLASNWDWIRWISLIPFTLLLVAIWQYLEWKRRKVIAELEHRYKPPGSPLDFVVPNAWKKYVYAGGYRALGSKVKWKNLFWMLLIWLAGIAFLLSNNFRLPSQECTNLQKFEYKGDTINICLNSPQKQILYFEYCVLESLEKKYLLNGDSLKEQIKAKEIFEAYKNGRAPSILSLLKEVNSNISAGLFNLGVIYANNGSADSALYCFNLATALNPNDTTYLKASSYYSNKVILSPWVIRLPKKEDSINTPVYPSPQNVYVRKSTIQVANGSNFILENKINLQNPSFENIPRAGIRGGTNEIAGWVDCGSPTETSPDIQPGSFQVKKAPFHGQTYLGLVVRGNFTNESLGQRLSSSLNSGSNYTFSIEAARSDTLMSITDDQTVPVNFASPAALKIWGGNRFCDRKELLCQTSVINNYEWLQYNCILSPKLGNYEYIIIECYYNPLELLPPNGNVLLDNCSPIVEISERGDLQRLRKPGRKLPRDIIINPIGTHVDY